MRVDLVDPPAYSVPYDDALAAALAAHGAEVRLLTSAFVYVDANPAATQDHTRYVYFYRHARGPAGSRVRTLTKLAEHVTDMLRYRRAAAREADVVHFQWLTVPRLDLRLLPDRPTVLTIHDPLERGGRRPPIPASAFGHVDAVVVHTAYARERVIAMHGLDPAKVHLIRHGVLTAAGDGRADDLPPELHDTDLPVVLCFGLLRPYKGLEQLLEAWRGITGAELWIVGRPMMDLAPLRACATSSVRILDRFVTPAEVAALFARSDLVVLPYETSERFGFSGVLATALGHGKAIVLSEVGGLDEVVALGAARGVPPGDADALHTALAELIADADQRARLAAAAAKAAADEFSWDAVARATLQLYETIASR